MTLGDNAYDTGTYFEFVNCYGPTWGAFKSRTKPSPGNHEYYSSGWGYYDYFGVPRYYAFNAGRDGSWRVYSLNSSIARSSASEQVAWLKRDLAAHPRKCVLAYWHHPRFSSGMHGNDRSVDAFWRALYAARADVILVGHDHDYERFAKQTPSGSASGSGIRQFVVGTGGRSLRGFDSVTPNSQKRYAGSHGVLKMTLQLGSYSWRFLATNGSVPDLGSSTCS